MKLFGSPGSPFARKVRIFMDEKRIPHEYVVARGSDPGSPIPQYNPLAKVPTLALDNGRGLYDSVVIVEYLDGIGPGPKLIPEAFEDRIEVRRWEALADGVAESTVAINHDLREPKEKQHPAAWHARQQLKIDRGLATLEKDLGGNEFCFGGRLTLADISVGYALGYLDFAMPQFEWRGNHPALARLAERLYARPSFAKSVPVKA
jgi:glutathione S-transferase